jgi:hypothetical protein
MVPTAMPSINLAQLVGRGNSFMSMLKKTKSQPTQLFNRLDTLYKKEQARQVTMTEFPSDIFA